jgi:hypothetical protein
MKKFVAHIGVTGILLGHLCGHLVVEAFHECMIEVSISPVMHYVEHLVGKAEALEETKSVAVIDPAIFRAHHRKEVN